LLKPLQWFSQPARQALLQGRGFAAAEACLIGLVSGLTAVILKQGIELCTAWRTQWEGPLAWGVLPLLGLAGGWLAGWLVETWGPETAGSGIPQVKAVLGYVPLPLNLRVAVVKLVGTIIALGSGLSLGRQGPTVQIGAALAAQLSRWVPTSPTYRRQLICAGAAAGLAAGFNAPMAGMLFVIEELLQDFSGLTLGTAILASFVGAVVSRLLGGQGLNLSMATLSTQFALIDLPFMLLLGGLAGLFGALFSRGIFVGLALAQRSRLPLPWRAGLAGLITAVFGVLFPLVAVDNTGLREFLVTGHVGWQLVLAAFVIKFGLTLLAYSSGAPGGIFAPALVLGAALGCLVGFGAQATQGLWIDPAVASPLIPTYALAGMGAFFSAVAQVPITSVVIIFEMTTDFNLVLPLMIVTAIAYLVSNWISSGSIYGRLLQWQGIQLAADGTQTDLWTQLTAVNLMERQVETLPSQMPLSAAMQAFSQSHHRGFPVVDEGKLVGIVTQTDLGKVTSPQSAQQLTLADVMTAPPVTVSPDAPITQVLHLLNQLKISRLPVTESSRLVGIITRGDIIRAESEKISDQAAPQGPQGMPSAVVYQRRAPATGQGCLVVPLSNPQTVPSLMRLAVAIATAYHYEIECVHIQVVPKSIRPAEAEIDLAPGLSLLDQARTLGQSLPVHSQMRVAHDVAQSLLEVIQDRHGNLLLMGWQPSASLSPERIFGSVVDSLIRQAPCQMMVVRLGQPVSFDRWLIPIAGGPNSAQALKLAPALLTLAPQAAVKLCYVTPLHRQSRFAQQLMVRAAQRLTRETPATVDSVSLTSDHVPESIVALSRAHHSDVILLGASRESLLSQVLHGNIPQKIAQDCDCTLILVRQAVGRTET
jgi:CIC family chloride channel protein